MNTKNPWKSIRISQLQEPQTISHMSQDAQLVYVLSGEVSLFANETSYTLGIGEFFVVPNFSEISLRFQASQSRVYLLTFAYFGENGSETMAVFQGDSRSRGEARNSILSTALQQLLKLYYLHHDRASYWEVGALYFQIINKLERKYLIKVPKNKGLLSGENIRVYLAQHLRDEVTIDSLAKQFFVSKQTMTRFIKKTFNQSLSKYLQEQRFEQLEKELIETDQAINSLAYDLGFKNINSFNRLFKSKYGLSPLQWRKTRALQVDKMISKSEVADFGDFEELGNDKISRIVVSAKTVLPEKGLARMWNIQDVSSLLETDSLERLGMVPNLRTLRIPLDFSRASKDYYDKILVHFAQKGITVHLVIPLGDIEQNNQVIHFFKQFLQRHSYRMTAEIRVEVTVDFEQKNWVADYIWLYHFLKQEMKIARCGLGILSLYQNQSQVGGMLSRDDLAGVVDFLSISALPHVKKKSLYSLRENIVTGSYINRVILQLDKFTKSLKKTSPNVPLFLSAFNLTAGESDAIQDHIYHAGYYLAFLDKAESLVDEIAYVTLFDGDFGKAGQEEFSGDAGLITKSGFVKAGLYAEQFRQDLPNQLIYKGEQVRIGKGSWGGLSVLAYNHIPMTDYYSSNRAMDLYQNQQFIFNMEHREVQLVIEDVPDGTYKTTFQIIDQENGSGLEVLRKYTGLNDLDETFREFFKTQYRPRIYQKEIQVSNQTLTEKLYLKPFEIVLVTYTPQYTDKGISF